MSEGCLLTDGVFAPQHILHTGDTCCVSRQLEDSMATIGVVRRVVVPILFGIAAFWHPNDAASQQGAQAPVVMVTEAQVRPDMIEQFHQFRLETAQIHARSSRPYPYTVATEDRGAYVFITRGFSDLADWERWSDANAALPAVPGGPRPPDTYSQVAWYMMERPEWSYIPDQPRVRREDAGFVHWDVYFGRQAMTRWGIPAQEAVAMSMVVVGGTSVLAAALHWWNGNFHAKAALLFAATGVIGAYGGSFLTHLVSQRALLGLFAALMLATGIAMVRKRSEMRIQRQCRFWPCLLIGAIVGVAGCSV